MYTRPVDKREVSVAVPATTANLGPGFDCLGMALDWWNHLQVSVASSPMVTVEGEGADSLSATEENLVYRAARAAFLEAGETPPPLAIRCQNAIPLARGLGSSAAAIVGGLVAGNALCESPLDQQSLLRLAVEMEGHADNVTPALLGGCQVVVRNDNEVIASSVPYPDALMAVVYVPDVPMSTHHARAILPGMVSREDAVYNIGRVAMLVNALSTGSLEGLDVATQDRLHQPVREGIFPAMKYIFRAARDAGALGVFLSGGGSSVLALSTDRLMTIGFEMADAAEKAGVTGNFKVTRPTPLGAHRVTD